MTTSPIPRPIYQDVTPYSNGMRLDADTMNKPIMQLADRTQWLYNRVNEIASGENFAAVRIPDVEVASGVNSFDCVYLRGDGLFDKAKADVLLNSNPFEISSISSFAVGIIIDVLESDGGAHATGTLVLSGLLSLDNVNSMLSPGEEFRPGPYYLSSKCPGKITADPSGPAVYIGTFISGGIGTRTGHYAIVAPQYKDIAEMHHHRAFSLSTELQASVVSSGVTNGFAPSPVVNPCNEIEDDANIPEIRLFVSGSYVSVDPAAYWMQVVRRQGDNDTYDVNFDGFPEVDGKHTNWTDSSIYVEWHDILGDEETNFGYSKVYVDSIDYAADDGPIDLIRCHFNIGRNGLVGRFEIKGGCEPANYRFGGPDIVGATVPLAGVESEDSAPISTIFSTSGGIGWRVADGIHNSDEQGFDYVYEIGLDSDLNKFFPPSPLGGCSLLYNGVELPSFELYHEDAVYKITNTKILWNSSKAGGLVPFMQSPSDMPIALTFYTTRGKLPSSSFVTSLKAAEGSGIKIREEGTPDPASTGNLVIDAQIPIDKSDPGMKGYRVVKDVVNNKLIFGPAVSSISGGFGVNVRSKRGQPVGCGDVTVEIDSAYSGGMFDDIVLHNAKQELIGTFPYIKLLGSNSVPSGFTMKTHIPISTLNVESGYEFLFWMSVFGLDDIVAGSTERTSAAYINMSVSVLQDWYPDMQNDSGGHLKTLTDNLTSIDIADALSTGSVDSPIAIPLGGSVPAPYDGASSLIYKAFDPIFVHNGVPLVDISSEEEEQDDNRWKRRVIAKGKIKGLHPNASIAITISRALDAGGGDFNEYTGEIGFMNMGWRLIEPDDSTSQSD